MSVNVTIDGYPIDCAKFLDHSLEADVTSEPVESGAEMNDHVQRMPARVTIEGWVSDEYREYERALNEWLQRQATK